MPRMDQNIHNLEKIDVHGQLLRFELFPKRFEEGMSLKNLRLDNNNIQMLFRGDLFYKIVKISSAVPYLFLYFILTSVVFVKGNVSLAYVWKSLSD